MAPPRRWARRALLIWISTWILAVATQVGVGIALDVTWVDPVVTMWIVVVAAALCAVLSAAVVARAFRSGSGETAMLGSFLMGISVLPVAHGLLIPGALYGANDGVLATAQLAVPVAALALVPLVMPARLARSLVRRWRLAVPAHLGLVFGLATAVLIWPDLVPAAPTGSPAALAVAVVSLLVCFGLSVRHLRLSLLSGAGASLVLSTGLALVGSAPLLFVVGEMYSVAFWLAHALDVTGVLLAAAVAVTAYQRGDTAARILEPIEATTPLRALEVGLDPLVHRFVADLDHKDRITRDHVVRTARMAVQVATELGLPPVEVRAVGLGAILHDVGKLDVPDEILTKPGRLTESEFEVMKAHTVVGHRLVVSSPALVDAAPYVRGHHERVDGRGYPDGLSGDAIPLGARIVAVCDAYDAMAHTRQYREGMSLDKVLAILAEHRGAQWDDRVVAALLRVLEQEPTTEDAEALGDVGRDHAAEDQGPSCCADAVPESAAAGPG